MGRKRYVSTDISTDGRVAQLAREHGLFAALLYTWMIPHAADDRTLTGAPYELMLQVVPGLALQPGLGITPEKITEAVDTMVRIGLLERLQDGRVRFPESFYKYQAYVKPSRRTDADQPPYPATLFDEPPGDSGNGAAVPGASGKTLASHSSSHPVSHSHSPSSELKTASELPPRVPAHAPAREAQEAEGPRRKPVNEAFRAEMHERFDASLGASRVDIAFDKAVNDRSHARSLDKQRHVVNWLRGDAERWGNQVKPTQAWTNGHATTYTTSAGNAEMIPRDSLGFPIGTMHPCSECSREHTTDDPGCTALRYEEANQ